MTWLWALVGTGTVLVLVDRVACWAESRGWLYWRRRAPGGLPGGGVVGDLIEIFTPSRRHVVEQRDRDRLGVHAQESEGGSLGVDLDRRTVRLPGQSSGPPAT